MIFSCFVHHFYKQHVKRTRKKWINKINKTKQTTHSKALLWAPIRIDPIEMARLFVDVLANKLILSHSPPLYHLFLVWFSLLKSIFFAKCLFLFSTWFCSDFCFMNNWQPLFTWVISHNFRMKSKYNRHYTILTYTHSTNWET